MPQFDRQAFGQRLRLLRDYREMTQQQVANIPIMKMVKQNHLLRYL